MFGRASRDAQVIVHLQAYVVYLLLNDEIRADHKEKFLSYLRETKPKVKDAEALTLLAIDAILNISENLGSKGSAISSCDDMELRPTSRLGNLLYRRPVISNEKGKLFREEISKRCPYGNTSDLFEGGLTITSDQ